MILRVVLPWPPRTANGNHQWIRSARGIRQTPEAAAYKEEIATLTRQAMIALDQPLVLDGEIIVTLRQYQPNKIRRDVDSNCKIVLDGLARGLGINDSRFSCLIAKLYDEPDRVNPRIEVTVEAGQATNSPIDNTQVESVYLTAAGAQRPLKAKDTGKKEAIFNGQ